MAHHKRRRPKNRRSGCLLCKPWKVNGFAHRNRADGQRFSDVRRMKAAQEQIRSQHGETSIDRRRTLAGAALLLERRGRWLNPPVAEALGAGQSR